MIDESMRGQMENHGHVHVTGGGCNVRGQCPIEVKTMIHCAPQCLNPVFAQVCLE